MNINSIKQYVIPGVGGDFSQYGYAIGIILFLLALSLIVGRFSRRSPIRKFTSRYFAWTSLAALVVYFFRFENVAYFNSVFWLYGLYVVYTIGVVWSLINKFRMAPKVMEQKQKLDEFQKYLPKTKKKRPVKEKNG